MAIVDAEKNEHKPASETVRVDLGTRGYDIRIGRNVLETAGDEIAAVMPGSRVAVVADENVAKLHLGTFDESLVRAGVDCTAITVPPGEGTKRFSEFKRLFMLMHVVVKFTRADFQTSMTKLLNMLS